MGLVGLRGPRKTVAARSLRPGAILARVAMARATGLLVAIRTLAKVSWAGCLLAILIRAARWLPGLSRVRVLISTGS